MLYSLPNDIILYIINYDTTIFNIALVCKKIYEISKRSNLIKLKKNIGYINNNILAKLERYNTFIISREYTSKKYLYENNAIYYYYSCSLSLFPFALRSETKGNKEEEVLIVNGFDFVLNPDKFNTNFLTFIKNNSKTPYTEFFIYNNYISNIFKDIISTYKYCMKLRKYYDYLNKNEFFLFYNNAFKYGHPDIDTL